MNPPAGSRIQIYTFGTLQVIRESTAVTEGDWHTRQARQLLKILITERPRPVSTDLLIELLWPNSTPHAAATTLRSAINALRNVLEPDRPNRAPSRYIVTQAPGYAFHSTPDIWLDVDVFEHRLNDAQTAADPAVRLAYLESAIELYKDDYLISDPYSDWLQNERERLRERFFTALLQAAEIYAEQGRYTDAITACRRLLARDEVRENAYQALMRYQAESGDSAGALLTYERCRALLSDELGADPSPLTQALHQRILNGEIEPRPVAAAPVFTLPVILSDVLHGDAVQIPPPELPPRALLPVLDISYPAALVGRRREQAIIDERWHSAQAGQGSLLALEGEAGVGKTRLAYTVLHNAAEEKATVISATCQLLEQELPFAALAESLSRYLYGLPDAVVRSLPAASLAQLAQIIPSLQDRVPNLPTGTGETGGSPDENRQRLIDGIVAFLAALAQQRPLLLFLDDLQWADPDTLAVISRLAQRLPELPLFLLLALRGEELSENSELAMLLHSLSRLNPDYRLAVQRFDRRQVEEFVSLQIEENPVAGQQLAEFLYATTDGNALFVTEALRDLEERLSGDQPSASLGALLAADPAGVRDAFSLRRNRRVQEIILERTRRLPADAHTILNLTAVIGRDFSLDLLEKAAAHDPLAALEVLLQRKFLIERPDERLDFSHQVVRQAVYDSLNILQRRRLHLAVAEALAEMGQAEQNPSEAAFHFGHAGSSYRLVAARYLVLAGEERLRTYGFPQAIDAFDRALATFEAAPDAAPDYYRRALQGRGLASESLFDPQGVTVTYRRLQEWAQRQGDRSLVLATYTRLTTMLGLMGQQSESNVQLQELLRALAPAGQSAAPSHVLTDLLERRRLIYSLDEPAVTAIWQPYLPAPPPVADPVADILRILEPMHAVLPLFDYGWVLLVQGQLGEATRVLEAVVDLAMATSQPSIASNAYHQLAVTARILGDNEQSQALNEASITINRAVAGTAAELASMWPRISSGYLSLQAGRLDEAERRLRRVVDFLDARESFSNYRNSANIGLGLIALERGRVEEARRLLEDALTDPVHLYPYSHVHAMLGLARIAGSDGSLAARDQLLRQALRFAGRRSLLEEYMAALSTIARLRPEGAPLDELVRSLLDYTRSIGLTAAERLLGELAAAA